MGWSFLYSQELAQDLFIGSFERFAARMFLPPFSRSCIILVQKWFSHSHSGTKRMRHEFPHLIRITRTTALPANFSRSKRFPALGIPVPSNY
jgi:hypothetical protein